MSSPTDLCEARATSVCDELGALLRAHHCPRGPRRLIRIAELAPLGSPYEVGRGYVHIVTAEVHGHGAHASVCPGPTGVVTFAELAHLASRPRTFIGLEGHPLADDANGPDWCRPYRLRTIQALALLAERLARTTLEVES